MWQVVSSNGVLQKCIVTRITSVKTEEHVTKMFTINTSATVSLALPENTVKQVSSTLALLMKTLAGASNVMAKERAWHRLCIKKLHGRCYTYGAYVNTSSPTSILTTFGHFVQDCIKILVGIALYYLAGFANYAFSKRENTHAMRISVLR